LRQPTTFANVVLESVDKLLLSLHTIDVCNQSFGANKDLGAGLTPVSHPCQCQERWNRCTNGGIAGVDTRVIERYSHQMVDICGIDNHEITTSIPIVTAGAFARSQRGDVILILIHQYAYHPQQGRLIHSSRQLESFASDGNDKLIHIPGGLQRIQTMDGYVFPLSIRDGFPYLGMIP
jgi:hypothetical protein